MQIFHNCDEGLNWPSLDDRKNFSVKYNDFLLYFTFFISLKNRSNERQFDLLESLLARLQLVNIHNLSVLVQICWTWDFFTEKNKWSHKLKARSLILGQKFSKSRLCCLSLRHRSTLIDKFVQSELHWF